MPNFHFAELFDLANTIAKRLISLLLRFGLLFGYGRQFSSRTPW